MKLMIYLACFPVLVCMVFMRGGAATMGRQTVHDSTAMAIPASPAALTKFLQQHAAQDFILVPERRENPICMFDAVPEIWTERTASDLTRFQATARPGEYFVFQAGVYAFRNDLRTLRVEWTNLAGRPELAKVKLELKRWLPTSEAPSVPGKGSYHFDPSRYTWGPAK